MSSPGTEPLNLQDPLTHSDEEDLDWLTLHLLILQHSPLEKETFDRIREEAFVRVRRHTDRVHRAVYWRIQDAQKRHRYRHYSQEAVTTVRRSKSSRIARRKRPQPTMNRNRPYYNMRSSAPPAYNRTTSTSPRRTLARSPLGSR